MKIYDVKNISVKIKHIYYYYVTVQDNFSLVIFSQVERELCQIYNVAFFEEAGDLPTLPRNDEGPGSGTESDTQNSNDQELPLSLKAKLARLKTRLSLCYDKLRQ